MKLEVERVDGRDVSPKPPLPPKHGRFGETALPGLAGMGSLMRSWDEGPLVIAACSGLEGLR